MEGAGRQVRYASTVSALTHRGGQRSATVWAFQPRYVSEPPDVTSTLRNSASYRGPSETIRRKAFVLIPSLVKWSRDRVKRTFGCCLSGQKCV